uniref:Disease resistance N-terminal domain-containing protein n=1 Tax=Fagus sylvatica TaxID=28930 RepID=A0A2N9FZQ4_FAGSY
MTELAFSVAEIVIEKLGSLAYQEISLAWNIKSDLKKLKLIMTNVKDLLLDAEQKQTENEGLRDWLAELKDVFHDFIDVLDEFDCEDLRRQVVKTRGSTGKKGETHSFVPDSDVIGRDDDKEKIIDLLMHPNEDGTIPVISIVGIGGVNGSKIVVTTRSHKVATVMAPGPIHDLIGLPEDDCLFLFLKWAFIEGEEKKYPKLVEIGKQIVKKCSGVPLAVRTLGSLLYSKTEERDWIDIRDDEIWKLEQKEDDILPALRLSYNQLPSYFKTMFCLLLLVSQRILIIIGLKHLTALESLLIWRCEKINLMEGEDYPTRLRSFRILFLSKLVALPHWLIQSATTLQFLQIGWVCGTWRHYQEWLPNLTSLQNLKILSCRKLSSLPKRMGHLTALRELKIVGCRELNKNCEREVGVEWPKIKHIPQIKIEI